jgi:hypothetical protein
MMAMYGRFPFPSALLMLSLAQPIKGSVSGSAFQDHQRIIPPCTSLIAGPFDGTFRSAGSLL